MLTTMVHYIDFLDHVEGALKNRRLMARMALNALGEAQSYPVDLIELRQLTPINRSIVWGFLDWVMHRRLSHHMDLLREERNRQPFRVIAASNQPSQERETQSFLDNRVARSI